MESVNRPVVAAAAEDERAVIQERYEVVRLLGEGSFARTLLCRDRHAGRFVAVKQLRMRQLDGDWKPVELFEREARVLALLRHHGVPEIHEHFAVQDAGSEPGLFLVQEYVEGDSLKQRLEQGPLLGEVELIQVTLGVLDVLEYLHSRMPPIFHRDIKPSNIIVRPSGAPVLVDFGGVCMGWRRSSEEGSTVAGTYGYMPPEQLLGQVGPSADLYALGATLLHVVTGRPPADFFSDAGRLEVPADLPVRPAMRRLIAALVEPAPRDRPGTARMARELLLGSETTALVPEAVTTALTVPAQSTTGIGSDVHFIDVGPPPRDPKGPHAHTYSRLVDLLGLSRIASRPRRIATIAAWWGLVGPVTLGIAPLHYYAINKDRRRRFGPLFEHGALTKGTIVSAIQRERGFASFAFDYMVGDLRFRSIMEYEDNLRHVLFPGDCVAVLYDPAEPTQACFLVR